MSRGNPRIAVRVRSELKADLEARAAELSMEFPDLVRLALEQFLSSVAPSTPSAPSAAGAPSSSTTGVPGEEPSPTDGTGTPAMTPPSDDALALRFARRAGVAVPIARREVRAGLVTLEGDRLLYKGKPA